MRQPTRSTLAEFLADAIVYRSLDPLDPRMPRFAEVGRRFGASSSGPAPRKGDPGYAHVVAELLKAAARLRRPRATVERIIFVGDTRGNDAIAFARICEAGGWPGIGFIGCDAPDEPVAWEVRENGERLLLLATRWGLLAALDGLCADRGFPIDGGTAVLIDVDKTAIGARGRNDVAIDRARTDAVLRTIAGLLGSPFDATAARRTYEQLNRPTLHHLTADNQDVVAVLCLAVAADLIPEAILTADDVAGDLPGLLSVALRHTAAVPPAVREVLRRSRDGAATGAAPEFEAFRRGEYVATVQRMGRLPADASRERLLAEEITITAEVREAALRWRDRGATLLGLSDKPDAASLPSDAMMSTGYRPLHRTEAWVMGEAV